MIIVEGIDGVGKTSVVSEFKNRGYNTPSYNYDKNVHSFMDKYFNIDLTNIENCVSDRSFTSEAAKGILVRGFSRLSDEEYLKLLKFYGSLNTKIIYLKADKNTLLSRRRNDPKDFEMISTLYDAIDRRYDEIMHLASKYLDVFTITTSNKLVYDLLLEIENIGLLKSNTNDKELER